MTEEKQQAEATVQEPQPEAEKPQVEATKPMDFFVKLTCIQNEQCPEEPVQQLR